MYVDRILDVWDVDGAAEALVCGAARVSRAEARAQLLRLAQVFREVRLRPGDVVGLFLPNRPESLLAQFAVHLVGCRAVFLPPAAGPGELAAVVRQARATVVVFDPDEQDRIESALGRGAQVERLFSLGPASLGEDLLALAADRPAVRPPAVAPVPDTEVVTILYTGGTTGRPKLVGYGHQLYAGLVAQTSAGTVPAASRLMVTNRLSHGSGQLSAIWCLLSGGTVIALPRFDAESALHALYHERVTSTLLVPPMLAELLDHPECRVDGLALSLIAIGGSAPSPARLRQAVERFGPKISTGYAQTECLAITSFPTAEVATADTARLRSCGRPLPGVRLCIRAGDGAEVPAGTVGEITVRAPTMMLGYYRDPERTAEAVRDGWLHTGDHGYVDADGYLYVVDRARDIIVTGPTSSNVYSRLLDDFLENLPGIRSAAAVAVPDERFGEAVHVFVTTGPDQPVDRDALRAAVVAELGELYRPREITVVPALPRTAVGKVDKKALRAMAVRPSTEI